MKNENYENYESYSDKKEKLLKIFMENSDEIIRELEKGEPDFIIRLKYALEVLNIMEIKNFELNNWIKK